MAKVLITGASGYVGQHLALAFAEAGRQVRGLSRSPCPSRLGAIEWTQGDITQAQVARQGVAGCTAVIHLACLPLEASERDPLEAHRVNAGGTLQVLEAARRVGVERIVYVSTGQVYGGHSRLPNAETDLPHPDSAYAASKLCGEVGCQTYARVYGMSVQILRLFNVYGAAADGSFRPTVESIFLRRLRQGQPPQIRGNLESGRDFIHVRDVVRAIGLALHSPTWEGAVNVGTGALTTLVELARLAAQVVGKSLEPEIVESDEPTVRFQADTRRAQALLGFRAQIGLEEGLGGLANRL